MLTKQQNRENLLKLFTFVTLIRGNIYLIYTVTNMQRFYTFICSTVVFFVLLLVSYSNLITDCLFVFSELEFFFYFYLG